MTTRDMLQRIVDYYTISVWDYKDKYYPNGGFDVTGEDPEWLPIAKEVLEGRFCDYCGFEIRGIQCHCRNDE